MTVFRSWRLGAAIFASGAAVGMVLVSEENVLTTAFDRASAIVSIDAAQAQEPASAEESPVKARPRDVYYPNSEDLAPDEMRVIACGTGMPTTRAAQAAACFLVELGNGDKFIFDIVPGSDERIPSLLIPYDDLDTSFIAHLNDDHI